MGFSVRITSLFCYRIPDTFYLIIALGTVNK